MNDERDTGVDQPEPDQQGDTYEKPAIIALGKLDKITFGAPGPPFEGATSYF